MLLRSLIDPLRFGALSAVFALGCAAQAQTAGDREATKIAVGMPRDQAQMGRRLNAAQLAELREQVRQQWMPRQQVVQSGDDRRNDRLAAPAADGVVVLPRSRAQ